MISVSDTGVGMAADVLAQVFEPFFTTKRDGQGTGLGLSHVYGFVHQSGGHAKIESQPGVGTTVKIYLPKLSASIAQTLHALEPAIASELLSPGAGETILVVEDNDAVRAYTATCLRDLGYRVLEAGDGMAALEILESEPILQLLLTDLGLPGDLDGRAIADRARAIRPQLPVLLMTAYAGGALLHEGRLDPGIDLLSKPFTPSSLAARVQQMFHRHRPAPHILVVEDEPMVRLFVADMLTERGCEVEEAGTGAEALAKYRAGNPFDLAIIDLGLPDCRGDEVVAQIRASDPDFPVILATGYAGTALQERFRTDPKLQIMGKPFDAAQLRDSLQRFGIGLREPPSDLHLDDGAPI
jgi:CheY-like chemotaxis protein